MEQLILITAHKGECLNLFRKGKNESEQLVQSTGQRVSNVNYMWIIFTELYYYFFYIVFMLVFCNYKIAFF